MWPKPVGTSCGVNFLWLLSLVAWLAGEQADLTLAPALQPHRLIGDSEVELKL